MNSDNRHASQLASAKQITRAALDEMAGPGFAAAARRHLAPDVEWHTSHPINTLNGREAVVTQYLAPLHAAFPDLERRTDLFFAGHWAGEIVGGAGCWVTCTGHWLGTFRADWLGIPATGEPATLRFGEFYRVDGGRIVEARILLDIVDLARQAGRPLLPPSSGLEILVPCPRPHDGLLFGATNPEHGAESLRRMLAMATGLGKFDGTDLKTMGMENHWHRDMMWYGPCGIGSMRGVDGFQRHHQGPFLHAFPDRRGGNHRARFAEGPFVASTGWPSVHATHSGNYLGVPATGRPISMRVMDHWRCEDGLLTENWVMIDLPELLLHMGVDVMARLQD